MTPLTDWIPRRWGHLLAHVRDEWHDMAKRWLPRHQDFQPADNSNIVVHYDTRNETAEHLGFWSPSGRLARRLAIDLNETADDVVVTADLPGLDAGEVAVVVTGGRLVIRGEKQHEFRHSRRGSHLQERRCDTFVRSLSMPCEVDADNAQATYQCGVLRVTLPKTEHAQANRIQLSGKE